METRQILMIFSAFGAVQSFFFGLYFASLGLRKINKAPNLFLGLLLLMVAIRTAKSTIYSFGELSVWYMNFGFAAHASAGPLLMLYLLSYIRKGKLFRAYDLLHFVPTLVIVVMCNHLTEDIWLSAGYSMLLWQGLSYFVLSAFLLLKFRLNFSGHYLWFVSLTTAIGALLFAYFSNFMLKPALPYVYAPLVYSIFIYLVSFLILRNLDFFKREKERNGKYKYLNLSDEDVERYSLTINKVMENDKPYLQQDFNLKKLSEMTTIPSYMLSYLFNEKLNQKFNDYANGFRIALAKEKLLSDAYQHIKISSIAIECGFNSLSSFNAAFKKSTELTPSEFRLQTSSAD